MSSETSEDEVRLRLQSNGLPAAFCTRACPAGRPAKVFLDQSSVRLVVVVKDLAGRLDGQHRIPPPVPLHDEADVADESLRHHLELDDLERIELGEEAGRLLGGDAGAALEAAVSASRRSGFIALSVAGGELLCLRFASMAVCRLVVDLLLERCPWVARPVGEGFLAGVVCTGPEEAVPLKLAGDTFWIPPRSQTGGNQSSTHSVSTSPTMDCAQECVAAEIARRESAEARSAQLEALLEATRRREAEVTAERDRLLRRQQDVESAAVRDHELRPNCLEGRFEQAQLDQASPRSRGSGLSAVDNSSGGHDPCDLVTSTSLPLDSGGAASESLRILRVEMDGIRKERSSLLRSLASRALGESMERCDEFLQPALLQKDRSVSFNGTDSSSFHGDEDASGIASEVEQLAKLVDRELALAERAGAQRAAAVWQSQLKEMSSNCRSSRHEAQHAKSKAFVRGAGQLRQSSEHGAEQRTVQDLSPRRDREESLPLDSPRTLRAALVAARRERDELRRRVAQTDSELAELAERLELFEQQSVTMSALQGQLQAERAKREQLGEQAQQQAKAFQERNIYGEQQMDQLASQLARAHNALEEQLRGEAERRQDAEARANGLEERLAQATDRSSDRMQSTEGASSERLREECERLRVQVVQELAKCSSAQAQVATLEARLAQVAAASSLSSSPDRRREPGNNTGIEAATPAAGHRAELLIQGLEKQLSTVELWEVALAQRQSEMQALIDEQGELREEHDAMEMRLVSEAAKQESYEACLVEAHAQTTTLQQELDNSGRYVANLENRLAAETSKWQETKDQTAILRRRLSVAEDATRLSQAARCEASLQEGSLSRLQEALTAEMQLRRQAETQATLLQQQVSSLQQAHARARAESSSAPRRASPRACAEAHIVTRTQSLNTPRVVSPRARLLESEAHVVTRTQSLNVPRSLSPRARVESEVTLPSAVCSTLSVEHSLQTVGSVRVPSQERVPMPSVDRVVVSSPVVRPRRELSADDVFDRIDKNRDGSISRQEFLSALHKGEFQVLPAPTAVLVYQDHASRRLPPTRVRKSVVSTAGARQSSPTRVTVPVTRSASLPRFGTASGEVSPRSGSGSATPPRANSPPTGGNGLTTLAIAASSPRVAAMKAGQPSVSSWHACTAAGAGRQAAPAVRVMAPGMTSPPGPHLRAPTPAGSPPAGTSSGTPSAGLAATVPAKAMTAVGAPTVSRMSTR